MPTRTHSTNSYTKMVMSILLTLFLVITPCVSQYAPGFGCNDTFLMVELHKCEKTMLQSLIDDPAANCREEVKKLQKCSRKLIVDRCYSSLYAMYPKLREAVEKMMDVTLKQVNKASFYCSDHRMKINWELIPNAVKKVLPCDKRFFEESLACAERFRIAFNANKKDPNLCRLYTETKKCSHRVSYIYCTSSKILSVNKLNPFCEGGMDLEELPNDNSGKGKQLKCMAHVCSNSSSPFVPTPPCTAPQEVTCETPKGLPFEYDACMTTRLSMEALPGVTVTQVNRNCSSSFLCNSDVLCNSANSTGILKSCEFNCCTGELCNKESGSSLKKVKPTKPTKLTKLAKHTKPTVSSFKCILSTCFKSSSQLLPSYQCAPDQEITCETPPGSPLIYDRCMTTRVLMEPRPGITVEQEVRNCSYSSLCQSELLCDTVNATGFVKRCDVQCCKGNLCNKKESTKPTPIPRPVTHKIPSQTTVQATESCSKSEKGVWTKVTPSWISDHKSHGIQVRYRSVNKGLVIMGRVTSYGCQRRPGSGLTTFLKGNWTQIMYTQEFQGSASCWRIFGNSGRKGGYKNIDRSGLEEFNPSKGDIVFNELKMSGKNDNAFKGITHMCGNPAKNFWHMYNGLGLRRATVMLRRKTDGSNGGIHTATACGRPTFVIKDIFVFI